MKILLVLSVYFYGLITTNLSYLYQGNNQVIYALNETANSNFVRKGQDIIWSEIRRVQASSYVLIRHKPDDTYYLQVTINKQFAYGGIFKYLNKEGANYKYQRIDGVAEDLIFVNYPLDILSKSQQYDENIKITMLNYQTSFGLILKF